MRQREWIKQSTISTKDQTKGIKYKKIKDQVNHSFTTYKKDYCNRNYNSNFETKDISDPLASKINPLESVFEIEIHLLIQALNNWYQ